ncbi:MAG TPA: erythromycin esterase family protein [Gemmatimonadaceae bacterium]|jgi:erythromycin esterase-like protein|nr:erythromycin esterase family protein [Gemmatimonadaceae bacterium]
MTRRTIVLGLAVALVSLAACHSAPPPPPPPPVPLSDSATAALQWVQSHAVAFGAEDSVATRAERDAIFAVTSGARVIGFSEMNEGTHEFPYVLRRALFALADSGVRGIALQASMADAMEIDRYVRGGNGDGRRLLRTLGIWRYDTREMAALVESIRSWNQAHPDRTIGFYGFEIPTAAHAVRVITSLPESVTGAPLRSWLAQRYACVAMNEGAHWGLEGRASDSTFWASCGPATAQALDSVIALRRRLGSRATPDLAFAEEMARLVAHHVSVGLRRMKREEANAEHVMFLANLVGENARLVIVGGDVEMGRLTLEKTTVQTGVPLGRRLGDRYRTITFTYGDGVVRTHIPNPNQRTADQPGLGNVTVLPPPPNTLEDVLRRASPGAYWLDMRTLPADAGGTWLKGPRPMRFITDAYTPLVAQTNFETPVEFPANFDGVVFVKRVGPVR